MDTKSSATNEDFNPRPPRGGRPYCLRSFSPEHEFQSTPSARRATRNMDTVSEELFVYFNPRPPRGGRPLPRCYSHQSNAISIHALREEGDHYSFSLLKARSKFQSTPSARRATLPHSFCSMIFKISIHALREEGDHLKLMVGQNITEFQSTPSARRATTFQG